MCPYNFLLADTSPILIDQKSISLMIFTIIQIRQKTYSIVIPILVIRSLQNFAWHVQNFVVITFPEFQWEQNEIAITFELW